MSRCLFILSVLSLSVPEASSSYADTFNEIQDLFRLKDNILGEGSYECYATGECVMEYSVDQLLTYREEPLCSRSEQGCGASVRELEKREELCKRRNEEWEMLCRRSSDDNCMFIMQNMEDMDCEALLREKRERVRREACTGFMESFDELCGGNGKKRAVDPLCARLLQQSEESGCGGFRLNVEKRSKKGCLDGWSKLKGTCYRYFPGPMNFVKANDHCSSMAKNRKAHLATLERTLVTEHTKFFDDIIQSSGAIDKIDEVLSKLSSHYNNGDWKDMIKYFDNWAWIGVKKVEDEWKWISNKNNPDEWTSVKPTLAYWVKDDEFKQPTKDGASKIRMDYGNCVTYFRNRGDEDVTGGWWNVACSVQLPFLCEMEVQ